MKNRIVIGQLEPKAYEAMMAMEKYLSASTLEVGLTELIRLRASQINGCAYCIEMHSKGALKEGEPQNKVFAISAWWESPLFSEKEKSAFAMTDEITQISKGGVSDTTFETARNHFSENEIAQMIMLIGLINTWNRIAVSTHMFHPK
ncbi:carboxymuconolactone decarboxylase family protein [Pedobacter sp. SD-b]|uniref:Carboxymuconolactone decarboxylase family protein n=1 Tax=Pedobacter segetis TaxID=2793069 RepID=A0ABS1BET6_9SPHI|nr:carboxymuconolactone decarboxylase family protein [Pedobacter segetis]MBK0381378.1 carboxymuconolactone decarboxylase family protein [Pedobacter segetis]